MIGQTISKGSLWETVGGVTRLITADEVDFQKKKAIAMVCDNGPVLPSSPIDGQWFYHKPTGRKVLMHYDGSIWSPKWSNSTMTMFVNEASGDDNQNNGGTSGTGAFKTWQYAYSQIPHSYSGIVDIYITAATYVEELDLGGKYAAGDFQINLHGTAITDLAETTATGGTTGNSGSEVQGTVVKTGAGWGVNAYLDKWVRFSADTATVALRNHYAIVTKNTADTLTITGILPAAPASGEKFQIEHPGTIVSGTNMYQRAGTTNVIYDNIEIQPIFRPELGATFSMERCKISGRIAGSGWASINPPTLSIGAATGGGFGHIHACLFTGTSRGIQAGPKTAFILRCKFDNGGAAVSIEGGGGSSGQFHMFLGRGTEIKGASTGEKTFSPGLIEHAQNGGGSIRITNCTLGSHATNAGVIQTRGGQTYYNANGTDKLPVAAPDSAFIS